ncbi:MAG TPA: branched-chain amino acid ABC transporter substrate-binding protein [Acidobacteriaceae bacterium]|nr:branched-chain amino acid ABC transporter substrate-binding protein [Acidobacteriaceae bacterium]
MIAGSPIAYWITFHVLVLVLILWDLTALHRGTGRSRTVSNLLFVLLLVGMAAGFGLWLAHVQGRQTGLEFASGYLIELSLSVDNLFVFLVMFRSFRLGMQQQRKALLVGVAGAIVMRGLFIFGGIALLTRFAWIQYLFGVLILAAAVRLFREKKPGPGGRLGRWLERFETRGRLNPRRVLLSAVVAIEVVDLLFAMDSVPAVLAVSHQPFVVYTSNIFAVLGLRSLYSLLANLLDRLRFLHFGLAAILGFVGSKMILEPWIHISIEISLAVILLVIAIATAASLLYPAAETRESPQPH